MNHIGWDSFFFGLAHVSARKSKDPSTQVGAVIVDEDNRLVSIGYNGFPKGMDDEWAYEQGRDFKIRYTLHAEENAISFAKRDLEGCKIYLTHPPCSRCLAKIKQEGIRAVYYMPPEEEWAKRWNTDEMLAIANHLEIEMYYGGSNGREEKSSESPGQEMGKEEGERKSD